MKMVAILNNEAANWVFKMSIFVCKRCGSKNISVVNTRKSSKYDLRRRTRQCVDCKEVFYTVEICRSAYNKQLSAYDSVKKAFRILLSGMSKMEIEDAVKEAREIKGINIRDN